MGDPRGLTVMVTILAVAVILRGGAVIASPQHHVVGDDRGWDPDSDLSSWLASRTFRVGDYLWLAYSAAHTIAEVKSKEEYDSCDVTNPIRMFSDGLDRVLLQDEGIRFFLSTNTEHCKNGLKLHLQVLPHRHRHTHNTTSESDVDPASPAFAPGPQAPSASTRLITQLSSLFCCLALALFHLPL